MFDSSLLPLFKTVDCLFHEQRPWHLLDSPPKHSLWHCNQLLLLLQDRLIGGLFNDTLRKALSHLRQKHIGDRLQDALQDALHESHQHLQNWSAIHSLVSSLADSVSRHILRHFHHLHYHLWHKRLLHQSASLPQASKPGVSACCAGLSAAIVRHHPTPTRNPRTLSPASATPTSQPQTQSPFSFPARALVPQRANTDTKLPWGPAFSQASACNAGLSTPTSQSLQNVDLVSPSQHVKIESALWHAERFYLKTRNPAPWRSARYSVQQNAVEPCSGSPLETLKPALLRTTGTSRN